MLSSQIGSQYDAFTALVVLSGQLCGLLIGVFNPSIGWAIRFSVRTMLIAMTLISVAMGLVVWLYR
jgi:hypothetical protein